MKQKESKKVIRDVRITMTDEVYQEISKLAETNCRKIQDQCRYLIMQGLKGVRG